MALRYSFDPIGLVIQVASDLYPDLDADISWYEDPKMDGCGSTQWEEGKPPRIQINVFMPIRGVIEVLAHEIAHVKAGPDAKHKKAWREVFDAIFERYCERVAELQKDPLSGATHDR